MNLECICQVVIPVLSASSIYLISLKNRWSKWGFVLGLIQQPCWFYSNYTHEQWGMFVLCFWYTFCWLQGIYRYFKK